MIQIVEDGVGVSLGGRTVKELVPRDARTMGANTRVRTEVLGKGTFRDIRGTMGDC